MREYSDSGNELVTDDYVFFYTGVFSQWYLCDFEVELLGRKLTLNCAEQGMMLGKALHFKDEEAFEKILKQKHPSQQKALGRQVRNFNKKVWDDDGVSRSLRGDVDTPFRGRVFDRIIE